MRFLHYLSTHLRRLIGLGATAVVAAVLVTGVVPATIPHATQQSNGILSSVLLPSASAADTSCVIKKGAHKRSYKTKIKGKTAPVVGYVRWTEGRLVAYMENDSGRVQSMKVEVQKKTGPSWYTEIKTVSGKAKKFLGCAHADRSGTYKVVFKVTLKTKKYPKGVKKTWSTPVTGNNVIRLQ